MALKRVVSIDADTGEVLPSTPILMPRRTANGFSEGWTATAMNAHAAIAESDLTGRDLKVFHLLCSRMAFGNEIPINATEFAGILKMKAPNFHRSLRALMDFGIVVCEARDGVKYYRLSPKAVWRGSARSHKEALRLRLPD